MKFLKKWTGVVSFGLFFILTQLSFAEPTKEDREIARLLVSLRLEMSKKYQEFRIEFYLDLMQKYCPPQFAEFETAMAEFQQQYPNASSKDRSDQKKLYIRTFGMQCSDLIRFNTLAQMGTKDGLNELSDTMERFNEFFRDYMSEEYTAALDAESKRDPNYPDEAEVFDEEFTNHVRLFEEMKEVTLVKAFQTPIIIKRVESNYVDYSAPVSENLLKIIEPSMKPAQKAPAQEEESLDDPKKCQQCPSKGFQYDCKCKKHFCAKHRYAEQHGCTFDYKGDAKAKIAKANPLIEGAKVVKF